MNKDTCFVIMPFGSPFDRYLKNIFVPVIEDPDCEPSVPTAGPASHTEHLP
jgi:hypothetical protein